MIDSIEIVWYYMITFIAILGFSRIAYVAGKLKGFSDGYDQCSKDFEELKREELKKWGSK